MKQLCKSCGKITEHNESGKRENPPRSPRCTFCGHPVKTRSDALALGVRAGSAGEEGLHREMITPGGP